MKNSSNSSSQKTSNSPEKEKPTGGETQSRDEIIQKVCEMFDGTVLEDYSVKGHVELIFDYLDAVAHNYDAHRLPQIIASNFEETEAMARHIYQTWNRKKAS